MLPTETYTLIRNIVFSIGRREGEKESDLCDLVQDIALQLALHPPDCPDSELRFLITRIVTNNICSKTSRYHYIYRKPTTNLTSLDASRQGQEEDDSS